MESGAGSDGRSTVSVPMDTRQGTKTDKRKKGFHRNNNDTDSSLSLLNPTKRLKMDNSDIPGGRLEDDFLDDYSLDTQPLLPSQGSDNENALLADGNLYLSLEGGHRKNGSTEDGVESDHSNNSDKFFSQIKAMEEKGKLGSTVGESKTLNEIPSIVGSGLSFPESVDSDIVQKTNQDDTLRVVHVFIKVIHPVTNQILIEAKNFKSDMGTVMTFLKKHEVDISNVESGYNADVSSEISRSRSMEQTVSHRLTASSFCSTIPRLSDASTLNRPSISSDTSGHKSKVEFLSPVVRSRRQHNPEPLLSSTRVAYREEYHTLTRSGTEKELTPIQVTKEPVPETDQKEATPVEVSSYNTSSSFGNTGSTSASISVNVKVEPEEGNRRRTRGIHRNGIASLKSVEEFKNPAYVKSATLWGSIGQDEVVFARWRDRSYYSGKIMKKGANDTWYIHFEDDMEDVASESHILPIKIIGVGTWTVYCPPEIYKPENAIIVGQRFLDSTEDDLEKTEYAAVSDEDGRVIICYRKNLTLTETDAKEMRKQYQVQTTPKAADLSLDNIVAGRRRRCGATSPTPSSMIRKLVAESTGLVDSNSKSEADRVSVSSESNLEISTPTSRKSPRNSQKTSSTKTMTTEDPVLDNQLLVETHTERSPQKLNSDADVLPTKDEEVDGNKIFQGMEFFLTACGGLDPTCPATVSYDKDEYRKIIERNGGAVIDVVGEEALDKHNVFLISDNYARTVKYIYALAGGIPCLSHNWVMESLTRGRIVDYEDFVLSSGFSIETKVVSPAHREKPLKDVNVLVTGASDELYKYWRPVLTAAEAVLLKRFTPKGKAPVLVPELTDILVTDTSCPVDILDIARERNIPIVKPEWLVQTIIMGKKVPYNGHDKYCITGPDV